MENAEIKNIRLIESIIFLENEPVSMDRLIRLSSLDRKKITDAIEILKGEYARDFHGMELIEIAGGFTFYPKKELWDILGKHYGKKNQDKLSRAAIETLSIIAYSQPVTRSEVENIRGVSSDGIIRMLQEKGLIKIVGKKNAPGKPSQYGTTKEFLKLFKLKSIADLPKLDEPYNKKFDESS